MPRFEYAGPSSPDQVEITQHARNIVRAADYYRKLRAEHICDFEVAGRSEIAAAAVLAASLVALLVAAAVGVFV